MTVGTVGNDFVRGISGGERKRVSIAEMMAGGCKIGCHDNSSESSPAHTPSTIYSFSPTASTASLRLATVDIDSVVFQLVVSTLPPPSNTPDLSESQPTFSTSPRSSPSTKLRSRSLISSISSPFSTTDTKSTLDRWARLSSTSRTWDTSRSSSLLL